MPAFASHVRRAALATTSLALAAAPEADAQERRQGPEASAPTFGFPRPLASVDGLYTRVRPELADLDGDGDLDLYLTVNTFSSPPEVRLYQNVGTASGAIWAAPVSAPFESLLDRSYDNLDLAFGDLDGDGDLDLLSWNGRSSDGEAVSLTYLENVGTATSPALSPAPLPEGAREIGVGNSIALVDIDGDGDLDRFSGSDYYVELYAQMNEGTPTRADFGPVQLNPYGMFEDTYSYRFNDDHSVLTFSDFDGDGDFDAFLGNVGGYLYISENVGTPKAPMFAGAVPGYMQDGLARLAENAAPALGDLNGDGRDDIVIGYREALVVSLQGGTPAANSNGLQKTQYGPTPALGDLDGDGDLDLLTGQSDCFIDLEGCSFLDGPGFRYGFAFIENVGSPEAPQFAPLAQDPFGLPSAEPQLEYAVPSLVDIDADGDLDLFFGGKEFSGVGYFENTGTPEAPSFDGLVAANPFGLAESEDRLRVAAGDLDGDGDSDLLVLSTLGDVRAYENTGTPEAPAFGDATAFPAIAPGEKAYATLADVDRDGLADLLIGTASGDVVLHRTTRDNGWVRFRAPEANPGDLFGLTATPRPAVGDLTGDGQPDLLAGLQGGDWVLFDAPLAPTVTTSLVPTGPTTIPEPGGSISFIASATNAASEATTARFEITVAAPAGRRYKVFDKTGTVPAGRTLRLPFEESVPRLAPAGTYTVRLTVDGQTTDSFAFEKVGSDGLTATAKDASVVLEWAGSGAYDVQRWLGETGMYERLGTIQGEGALRFRTAPLAAGAHRFRVVPLDAERWEDALEVDAVVGLDAPFLLSDVTPNPFGARGGTFTLAIAEEHDVTVAVFDALGREVQHLHDGPLAEGRAHRFRIAGDLAPGVYVLRVTGADVAETRTVTLLR